MERLQKVIAACGICSRRKAEELIKEGKVLVNSNVVTTLGFKVDFDDVIMVNGKKLTHEAKEYYMLNKPRGVVSTTDDEKDRKTITELIDTKARIYPIGRLDYDTTGLILLTNDGELANILMHPKTNVEKTYLVKLNKILTMEDYFKIKKGIVIDNRKVLVKRLKIKSKDEDKQTSFVEITIIEGRNHIIKKIFEFLHYDVIKLKREGYGFLTLGNLNTSEYRSLSKEEVEKLYSYRKE